ncbi:DUF547 domain-containing protein [Flavobacterium faecale]|uniref:DUF547 domain-containing protein n=1 Tax=Flavobacterium faecale TaxID=1355330 RepID=UPI003AABC838
MKNYPLELSEQLLQYVKTGKDTKELRRELFYVRANKLCGYLSNDELKQQFWINIYNAYLHLLKTESQINKSTFDVKRIKIGYNRISLNDIEFRILKKKGLKNYWGIANYFDSPFIKKLSLQNSDQSIISQLDKYGI